MTEEQTVLEVVVLHPRDAAAATAGGADRLVYAATPDLRENPDPAGVSAIVRETNLPVRVVLPDPSVALAQECLLVGAAGVSFGLLDDDLRIDRQGCADLVSGIGGAPWTFRGLDLALDTDRAWQEVAGLPGLDAVVSAGSTRGLDVGGDDLLSRCQADPAVAALVLAAGNLTPDLVPWLVRAGVRQFGVGASVRPGRSWTRSYVDAGHVRSWSLLLDDALSRALGLEP